MEKHIVRNILLAAITASFAAAADATFVGMNVVSSTTTQVADTFSVFKVYAKSATPTTPS